MVSRVADPGRRPGRKHRQLLLRMPARCSGAAGLAWFGMDTRPQAWSSLRAGLAVGGVGQRVVARRRLRGGRSGTGVVVARGSREGGLISASRR